MALVCAPSEKMQTMTDKKSADPFRWLFGDFFSGKEKKGWLCVALAAAVVVRDLRHIPFFFCR